MNSHIKTLLSFSFIVFFTICILAQPKGKDYVLGQSFTISSEILKEDRPYLVYVPSDYDENNDPLAVMYLLDGYGNFLHTCGIASFLTRKGRIPPMMVVAIPNTSDRIRDLTPAIEVDSAMLKQRPTAGGADNMLAFLKDELIPHIDHAYNTNTYKILTGHSLGGLFAVHSLLSEPDLFDAYISISPSMWWDNQNMVTKAESFLTDNQDLDCFFYMTMANEGGKMLGGAMKLAALFEEYRGSEFKWDFVEMEEETHGTIPHRSTYNGLETIFKDWFVTDYRELYDAGGLQEIKSHFSKLSAKLGARIRPSETRLNRFGYAEMNDNNLETALDIFLENVKLYPTSYNVWDSAAEAYMKKGDKTEAIKHYKESLKLNPGNSNGIEMLKKLGVTYDPLEFAVKLVEAEQKAYLGEYDVSMGGILSIKVENGELQVSHPAIPTQTMHYYSNNLFLLLPDNVPMKFEVDDLNNISGFTAQVAIGFTLTGKKKSSKE